MLKCRILAYHLLITLGILACLLVGQWLWALLLDWMFFNPIAKTTLSAHTSITNQALLYAIALNAITVSVLLGFWVAQKHKQQPHAYLAPQDYFALHIPKWRPTCLSVLLFLTFMGLSYWLIQRWHLPPNHTNITLINATPIWQAILIITLVAPICEEWIFRGFLWRNYNHLFVLIANQHLRTLFIILANSLTFTLIHLQYQAAELALVFLLSCILCLARHSCRSLLVPICLHIINNLLALIFALKINI